MVRSAIEDLPEDGVVDFQDWMTRISLHIVLRTLFGAEPGGGGLPLLKLPPGARASGAPAINS